MEMPIPMRGWNTWNTFGANINDNMIRESADTIVKSGLKDAGYEYIVIDDCWSLKDRDENGCLVADPAKFPYGMKALADYIHSLGFKFGMYSCVGTKTCAGYPGSFGHEFQDAQTFADWGVDFLKYDYCYKPDAIDGRLLYNRMSMALKATGRDIIFSACSWGADDTAKWIRSTGADMWRSTGDIVDSWASVKSLFEQQREILPYGGLGCFNDMDMLIVGMNGKGHVGVNGCTLEEYRTHFTLWCFMSSPLMVGCDVRTMDDAVRDMLTNREVLAIQADAKCQPFPATKYMWGDDTLAWAKQLSDGGYALLYANMTDSNQLINTNWWDLGLPPSSGFAFAVRDVWSAQELGVYEADCPIKVKPHECRLLRLSLVPAKGAKA